MQHNPHTPEQILNTTTNCASCHEGAAEQISSFWGDTQYRILRLKCSSCEIVRTSSYFLETSLTFQLHSFILLGVSHRGTVYYFLLLSNLLRNTQSKWKCHSSYLFAQPSFFHDRQSGDPGTASVTTLGSILDFQPPLTAFLGVHAPLVHHCLHFAESTPQLAFPTRTT